jgi:ABC-2 type transport system ATP-binding protein
VTTIIETHALRRDFTARGARGARVVAVHGLDLQVRVGEIFGFLGPNGAGKTTTLRMLATLLAPSAGDALVAGLDLRRQPHRIRRHIGYVAQGAAADPGLTARAELVFQARLHGMSRSDARARAAELIADLELDGCADRTVETYSGGQRRRLELALGIVHRPRLLFLDEPTAGLDPQVRARLWEELRGMREQGMTIFLTTHYLEEADALCDRLTIIDGGRIVAQGTPDELKRQVAGDVVTIGVADRLMAVREIVGHQPFVRDVAVHGRVLHLSVSDGEAALPALIRLLDGAGFDLRTVALNRPTLDDVFLRKTGRSLGEAAPRAIPGRRSA